MARAQGLCRSRKRDGKGRGQRASRRAAGTRGRNPRRV